MYGIFTYIYHRFKPNVGKYTIHGAGYDYLLNMSGNLKGRTLASSQYTWAAASSSMCAGIQGIVKDRQQKKAQLTMIRFPHLETTIPIPLCSMYGIFT